MSLIFGFMDLQSSNFGRSSRPHFFNEIRPNFYRKRVFISSNRFQKGFLKIILLFELLAKNPKNGIFLKTCVHSVVDFSGYKAPFNLIPKTTSKLNPYLQKILLPCHFGCSGSVREIRPFEIFNVKIFHEGESD